MYLCMEGVGGRERERDTLKYKAVGWVLPTGWDGRERVTELGVLGGGKNGADGVDGWFIWWSRIGVGVGKERREDGRR